MPGANLKQDALRDEIKGRPKQTYLRPDRKWIMGYGSRIFNYLYFDPSEKVMLQANVFELEPNDVPPHAPDPGRAGPLEPLLKTWIFENGWSSDFQGARRVSYTPFQATTFPELTEPPDYFLKEAVQDKQMNFLQLDSYISDLRQSGFDTVKLQVQFYRKFSVPLFALIMAADRGALRIPGGQPGRHDGDRREHRDRHGLLGHRHALREDRGCESAPAHGGGLVAGYGLRPHGNVSAAANAELSAAGYPTVTTSRWGEIAGFFFLLLSHPCTLSM